jgi:transposase
MIRCHLWGIINAIVLKVTNGPLEAINGRIQKLKREACGYRNRERFRRMILSRLGGLHLYPDGVGRSGAGQLADVTHTKP